MFSTWVFSLMVAVGGPPPTVICVAAQAGPEWPTQIAPKDMTLALNSRVEAAHAVVRLCAPERLAVCEWQLQLVTLPNAQIRFDIVSPSRPFTGTVNVVEHGAESTTQLLALAIAESLRPALQQQLQGPRYHPPLEPTPPPATPLMEPHQVVATTPTKPPDLEPWADVGVALAGAWLVTPERLVARANLWLQYRIGEFGFQVEGGGGLWPTHTHRQVTIAVGELQGGIGPTLRLGGWLLGTEIQWRRTALTLDSKQAPLTHHQITHSDLGAALSVALRLWDTPNQTVEVLGTGSGWKQPLRLRREGQWLLRQSRWELGAGFRWSLPWR